MQRKNRVLASSSRSNKGGSAFKEKITLENKSSFDILPLEKPVSDKFVAKNIFPFCQKKKKLKLGETNE